MSTEPSILLHDVFEQQRQHAAKEITDFYNMLSERLMEMPPEEWCSFIGREEARNLSLTVHNMGYNVRDAAIRACAESKDISVTRPEAVMIWAKSTSGIPAPEVATIPFSSVPDEEQGGQTETASPSAKENRPPHARWLIIGGASLEIIGWILMPSGVWSAVVGGIALIAITGGVVLSATARKTIVEPNEDFKELQRHKAKERLSGLCSDQCSLNIQRVHAWISALENAFTQACLAASAVQ